MKNVAGDGRLRLTALFAAAGHSLFMPFAVAGYPDLAASLRVLSTYRDAGADLVELGVPCADPVGDGAVIAAASRAAAARGVGVAQTLALAAEATAAGIDVVMMTYAAVVPRGGRAAFFAGCRGAGVVGVVMPDLPPDEARDASAAAAAAGVALAGFLTPVATRERIADVAANATGFVYCASTSGRTGGGGGYGPELSAFLGRVRAQTALPLVVGFGVSTPAQAARVAAAAEGVVVGSALVALVGATADIDAIVTEVGAQTRAFCGAVRGAPKAVAGPGRPPTTR